MKIEVTAEDIAAGKPLSHSDCPIACAIRRQTGQSVKVGGNVIENADGGWWFYSEAVARFMEDFDRLKPSCHDGSAVHPFSFEVPDGFLS